MYIIGFKGCDIVENAKLFKEDMLRRNVKNSSALNL